VGRALAFYAFALAVGLILAEIAARVWLGRYASDDQFTMFGTLAGVVERSASRGTVLYKYEPHRYLGYVPAANFERGLNRHNKFGYRGEDFPKIKPKGEFRIVCVGGSTTYTSRVEDSALSYPSLLEEELHAQGKTQVRVINAGVEGWASYETLINFQLRLLDLNPDLVIVYHGVNDAVARLVYPPRFYKPDNSGYTQATSGWSQPVSLWDRSVVLRIIRNRLGFSRGQLTMLNAFGGLAPSGMYWYFAEEMTQGVYPLGVFEEHPVSEMFDENRPAPFRRNIGNVIATARSNRVDVVLATFAVDRVNAYGPRFASLNHPEFVRGIDDNNAILKQIASRDEVPLYDFAAEFPLDRSLFSDPVHVSAEGSRLKAKLFARFLLRTELIPDVAE